jgi:hypothetical protein
MEDFLNNMNNPEQIKGLWWTAFGLCFMALYLAWLFYFFNYFGKRLRKRVEERFDVKIQDKDKGMWSVVSDERHRVPWYKALFIQFLQIPVLVIAVLTPFAVLMLIWFLLKKTFW